MRLLPNMDKPARRWLTICSVTLSTGAVLAFFGPGLLAPAVGNVLIGCSWGLLLGWQARGRLVIPWARKQLRETEERVDRAWERGRDFERSRIRHTPAADLAPPLIST